MESATKERKKAGLPEINLDALPSSQCQKYMKLDLRLSMKNMVYSRISNFEPKNPGRLFTITME